MSEQAVTKVEVGMRASTSRTITETDIVLFAGLSGDFNPAHLDDVWAKSSRWGGRIAHGLLSAGLISGVLGTKLPGVGTIWLEQSLKFLHPVHPGDTVTAEVVIKELLPKGRVRVTTTCKNQDNVLVLDGEGVVLVPRSNPTAS
jgi:3-hydroxybutyryl-CoA dehydratase